MRLLVCLYLETYQNKFVRKCHGKIIRNNNFASKIKQFCTHLSSEKLMPEPEFVMLQVLIFLSLGLFSRVLPVFLGAQWQGSYLMANKKKNLSGLGHANVGFKNPDTNILSTVQMLNMALCSTPNTYVRKCK